MRVRSVIDAITPGASGTAFKPEELSHQPIRTRKNDSARVKEKQHVAKKIALALFSRAIADAVLGEEFARE